MRTIADLRALCGALPGTIETFPFDATTLVFKVGAERPDPEGPTGRPEGVWKMYALADLTADPVTLSLKCDPVRAEALRAEYPGVQPGYHLNKRHWNTLTLDGALPDDLVRDLVRHAHDLVVRGLPRDVRARVAAPGGAR